MGIHKNIIKCRKCGDIIESKTVHDFKWCGCGSVAVDGGHEYMKRCGSEKDYEELSIYDNDDFNETNNL